MLKDMMTRHGGNYFSRLTADQKKALKGVLFSVMEARYRNKNVQGKADLKINMKLQNKVRDNYLLKAMKITGISKDERDFFGGHIDLSNENFDLDKNIKYTYVFDARNSSELIEKTY